MCTCQARSVTAAAASDGFVRNGAPRSSHRDPAWCARRCADLRPAHSKARASRLVGVTASVRVRTTTAASGGPGPRRRTAQGRSQVVRDQVRQRVEFGRRRMIIVVLSGAGPALPVPTRLSTDGVTRGLSGTVRLASRTTLASRVSGRSLREVECLAFVQPDRRRRCGARMSESPRSLSR